ncbi:MAG: LysM peptidoglycan-binding domain-containing M23 family metallopeptidase [Rhodobacteraceae bacterium]|nr:LysM peptidoglycan-binding domain-containing M23 family metallopeptidase [Paracoccaceae bacterium]
MTPLSISLRSIRALGAVSLFALLAACTDGFDIDLRGGIGNNFDTTQAARDASHSRPEPDARGIITYPTYQVAVAQRGDTLDSLAARVGLPAQDIAQFNGLDPQDSLRRGEVIALPRKVATGTDGVFVSDVDITELASSAIDNAADTTPQVSSKPLPDVGPEPIRHKVKRGETVYTLSRLYNISVRSIADWNALDRSFTIREGQYLLIPKAEAAEPVALMGEEDASKPGEGSATPQPPSAKKPLPEEDVALDPKAQEDAIKVPDIGQKPAEVQAANSGAAMIYPVTGSIIRAYAKGRNEGIDIAAEAGTPIKAAASGSVSHVSETPDGVPILLISHPGNLTTIYTNLDGITVKTGDSVSKGQRLGKIRASDTPYLHFEVREGYQSVDPLDYLN